LDHLGDVRAVAAAAGGDGPARLRIDAELALARRLREELFRLLDRQLVGDEIVRNVRARLAALEIRAVAPDAEHDPGAEVDRVDLARVDRAEIGHELVQTFVAVGAEVEAAEPLDAMLVTRGDPVEVVLHRRGEPVVDESPEVLLEETDDREGEERGYERRP